MDAPSPTPSSSTYASALSGDEQDDLSNAMNLLALRNSRESSVVKEEPSQPEQAQYGLQPPLSRSTSAPTVPQTKGEGVDEAVNQDRLHSTNILDVSTADDKAGSTSVKQRTAVIFQEACLKHKYTRNNDSLYIVERPERLRAIKTGVAAAWARLEQRDSHKYAQGELDALMSKLDISSTSTKQRDIRGGPFDILFSDKLAHVDDPALTFVHPLPNAPPADFVPPVTAQPALPPKAQFETPVKASSSHDVPASAPPKLPSSAPAVQPAESEKAVPWPRQLQKLCRDAGETVLNGPLFSEIPAHLPQGDLYLATDGGSEEAIFGAVGAVCEAVDRVVSSTSSSPSEQTHDRAFVAIRPPGHHCCETNPMGFCFVCNVAVAAAHAHLKHGINRVVIVDIDLHHGNGTQEIAWRINDAANKAVASFGSPRKGSPRKTSRKRPLQVMYSSLHDIFSYPCEDGDMSFVQAASLNVTGGHSQWIANVHLQKWQNETEFHERLYHKYRSALLDPPEAFCRHSLFSGDDPDPSKVLVILSAGFDASEHESAGMSRHAHNVPTSFYHRFARDMAKFANEHAQGKLVAVLEGGYSDRALCSGSMAMLVGMSEYPRLNEKTFLNETGENGWWSKQSLDKIEKALSANGLASSTNRRKDEPSWLERSRDIFARIDSSTQAAKAVSSRTPNLAAGGTTRNAATGAGMTLRERKSRTALHASASTPSTPNARRGAASAQATPIGRPATAHPLRQAQTASRATDSSAFSMDVPPVPPVPRLELPNIVKTDDESGTSATDETRTPSVSFKWKAGGIG